MCPIADTGEDITIILKIMLLGYNKKKTNYFSDDFCNGCTVPPTFFAYKPVAYLHF